MNITDGIICIDKPAGVTSFGVVARIRRVLSKQQGKKVKVGHTGTLDPFATGLMILVVGKACKEAQRYTKLDKTYEATITLGADSTTGDPEGEITKHPIEPFDSARIEAVCATFVGQITQRPPIFSAIKINGQRAYKLARDGKEVEIPERTVTVYNLEIVQYEHPHLIIRTHVSSGTYIRSLAVDIGSALGTHAYCSQLRRTTIDAWDVKDAQKLIDFGVIS